MHVKEVFYSTVFILLIFCGFPCTSQVRNSSDIVTSDLLPEKNDDQVRSLLTHLISKKRASGKYFLHEVALNKKDGSARTFVGDADEVKRGGARMFLVGPDISGGARMFALNTDTQKRGGARMFTSDNDPEKRGGARMFAAGSDVDGEQKRGGARMFALDSDPEKRDGARIFISDTDSEKRGGGRMFQTEKRGGAHRFATNRMDESFEKRYAAGLDDGGGSSEKRAGARPFFGGFSGNWKRGGALFFASPYSAGIYSPHGFSYSFDKRAGARNFADERIALQYLLENAVKNEEVKRSGARAFGAQNNVPSWTDFSEEGTMMTL